MKKIWVDLFELPHLRGRRRRLLGPGVYNHLRQSPIHSIIVIESLAAGPEAFVRLFDANTPNETIWWMRPNTIVDALNSVSGGERINSLDLSDSPPALGSAGYDFFQRTSLLSMDDH